jgi:probable HAF family extracellular repeat protein
LLSLIILLSTLAVAQTPSYTFTIFSVAGASATIPQAINDQGQIVGFYFDSNGHHGFLYDQGSFSTINVPGTSHTYASAINQHGQIAGYYFNSQGQEQGFLATPNKKK